MHLLTIDPATGLAIDQGSGQPTLGTSNPEDAVFASGFALGPIGLEIDETTGRELFVATFDDSGGENIVYQIGGFTAVTTTTVPSSPTTTTLPGSGCAGDGSLPALSCRAQALVAAVDAADVGSLRTALHRKAEKAAARIGDAEDRSAAGKSRPAKKALAGAARALKGFRAKLGSRRARREVPEATRTALGDAAGNLLADVVSARAML